MWVWGSSLLHLTVYTAPYKLSSTQISWSYLHKLPAVDLLDKEASEGGCLYWVPAASSLHSVPAQKCVFQKEPAREDEDNYARGWQDPWPAAEGWESLILQAGVLLSPSIRLVSGLQSAWGRCFGIWVWNGLVRKRFWGRRPVFIVGR